MIGKWLLLAIVTFGITVHAQTDSEKGLYNQQIEAAKKELRNLNEQGRLPGNIPEREAIVQRILDVIYPPETYVNKASAKVKAIDQALRANNGNTFSLTKGKLLAAEILNAQVNSKESIDSKAISEISRI